MHLRKRIFALLGRLRWPTAFTERSGSVAVIFALALLPVILMVGGALDFAKVFRARSQTLRALDSAAVAGAAAAVRSLQSGASVSAAKTAGDNAAEIYLTSNFANQGGVNIGPYALGGNVTATTATYSPTATINVQTAFLRLVGMATIPASVSATATASAGTYVDVYLMIDISGSMMIGATQKDMDALSAKFGCVLACHDGATNVWNGSFYGDAYQWATNNNVSLRYEVLLSGVTALVNYLNSIDPSHARIRLALYTFDTNLTKVSSLSYNFSNVISNYPTPAIDSSEGAGATLFNENIDTVISDIGQGGDGSSAANPSKLLIIATDGVEDPGRQWVQQASLRPKVKVFNTKFCRTLKQNNVALGIIDTPYLPMLWDWGYNATLGQPGNNPALTRVDDIAPAFKQCAGGLFLQASDTATIQSGFTTLFQAFNATRLSK
jgi:Flp pilus assembly protein TadG